MNSRKIIDNRNTWCRLVHMEANMEISFLTPSEELVNMFNEVKAFENKLAKLLGECGDDLIMYSYSCGVLPLVPDGTGEPMHRQVSFSVEELFSMFSSMAFRNDGVVCKQFYAIPYNDVLFFFRADKGEAPVFELFDAARRDVAVYFAEKSIEKA